MLVYAWRKKGSATDCGVPISWLGAVIARKRGIAVLKVRTVRIRREAENKTFSVVSVMADGL